MRSMLQLFPSGFEFWQYSWLGRTLFWFELVVALVVSVVIARRHPETRAFMWIALLVLFVAVAQHIAAVWTLAIDPHRGSGTLPIPQPFKAAGYFATFTSNVVGPFLAGLLLGRSATLAASSRVAAALAIVVIAAYALYIAPWASVIILD